ncbi:hypothetical protein [Flavobacterium sharifuzzamanii]|uniref:hypothetical protein n=1 Tax=Flavobacterium sharifuzzamanii TaxID=2211133 RepID=UPI000DAF2DD7|nr:hypothetical protein [Flavobacterium sharifuzzamanii]KAF2080195.1 hypothetical protein DMA14_12890 [Flavobacterium sharifuzzamanii]
MDLNIVQYKNEYYELAQEYLKKIDFVDLNILEIIPKSISIVIDHDFIPTPCIEIKLELSKGEKKTANYFLYLNENKEFVDEFLY